MQTQIDKLKKELQMKDIQLEEIRKDKKSMDSHAIQQRTKLKEAEDQVNKLTGQMLPKLKDTVNRQKGLFDELN